jgi:hypothetical protein
MLKKYNIKSYTIVVVLVFVLILPVNAIAQVNAAPQVNTVPQRSAAPQVNTVPQRSAAPQVNTVPQRSAAPQVNTVPQRSAAPQVNTVPPKKKLSVSAVLAKKIATLEGELSRTKTALFTAGNAGLEKDKKINMFTASIQSLQGAVSEKNIELAGLYEEIKGLQVTASERSAELGTLKDGHKKHKDVITCYKKALNEWDNHLRKRVLSEQDRLSISTVLHAAIRECPPTQADVKLGVN